MSLLCTKGLGIDDDGGGTGSSRIIIAEALDVVMPSAALDVVLSPVVELVGILRPDDVRGELLDDDSDPTMPGGGPLSGGL